LNTGNLIGYRPEHVAQRESDCLRQGSALPPMVCTAANHPHPAELIINE